MGVVWGSNVWGLAWAGYRRCSSASLTFETWSTFLEGGCIGIILGSIPLQYQPFSKELLGS